MSATHALPGEVIEVGDPLPAARAVDIHNGSELPLDDAPPGYYTIVRQRDDWLYIVAVGEDIDGHIGLVGPLFVVPKGVLETETVIVTPLAVAAPEPQ